jgi:hypothetical protein
LSVLLSGLLPAELILSNVLPGFIGPVEQMREQILLTADTAVDRLDGKIAQMEILLAEIDRRSTALVQQSKQQQLAKLQLEQQQQQLATWLQSQRQLLETEIQRRQQEWLRLQTTSANGSRASAPIEARQYLCRLLTREYNPNYSPLKN